MPNCDAVNYIGVRCSRNAGESPYFIYHDGNGRLTTLKYLCFDHSQQLLGVLMETELGHTRLLEQLKKKINSKYSELNRGSNITEEREKIREAIAEGRPKPKFKSVDIIKKEIRELQEKRKRIFDIRNHERNKKCRFCGFDLTEPEDIKDQIGIKFSHANFHTAKGYRRVDIMFHTECGITWFTNKIFVDKTMKYLSPLRVKQNTLFTT